MGRTNIKDVLTGNGFIPPFRGASCAAAEIFALTGYEGAQIRCAHGKNLDPGVQLNLP